MLGIGGVSQEDSKGVPPLAARSGFNTPTAESNGKYKIDFERFKARVGQINKEKQKICS
jgi:hypothetical protein